MKANGNVAWQGFDGALGWDSPQFDKAG